MLERCTEDHNTICIMYCAPNQKNRKKKKKETLFLPLCLLRRVGRRVVYYMFIVKMHNLKMGLGGLSGANAQGNEEREREK